LAVVRVEASRLVAYTSTQPGLPGTAGLFDRILLKRGIRRAFERTFDALERELTRR
jgi:hypothetical protein